MSNLLEIMDKKSCGKSEIYISEEDGRWYACYRSAHLLKKLNETVLRGVMLDISLPRRRAATSTRMCG